MAYITHQITLISSSKAPGNTRSSLAMAQRRPNSCSPGIATRQRRSQVTGDSTPLHPVWRHRHPAYRSPQTSPRHCLSASVQRSIHSGRKQQQPNLAAGGECAAASRVRPQVEVFFFLPINPLWSPSSWNLLFSYFFFQFMKLL